MIMPKRTFVLVVAVVVLLLLFVAAAQAAAAERTRPACSRVALVVPTGVHGWFGVECPESRFPVVQRYLGQPMPVISPASVHTVHTSTGVQHWLRCQSANGTWQLYLIVLP